VTLAVGCHVARERQLATVAVFPEFARLPELASKHRRLVSPRHRRALVTGLRRAASPSQPPRRFDCCPVLRDRIAGVRLELRQIANDLEPSNDPDLATVALIHELLTSACSPLYNPNVPLDALHATLTRARNGIAAPPHACCILTGDDSSILSLPREFAGRSGGRTRAASGPASATGPTSAPGS
jgi:hypothetical protein